MNTYKKQTTANNGCQQDASFAQAFYAQSVRTTGCPSSASFVLIPHTQTWKAPATARPTIVLSAFGRSCLLTGEQQNLYLKPNLSWVQGT